MTNRRKDILRGAFLGFVLTIPLTALMFFGWRVAELPMVAFDLLESIARISQLGGLVTSGIDAMVAIFSRVPGEATDQIAKAFEQAMAIVLFLLIGSLVGTVYAIVRRQLTQSAGFVIGLATWGAAMVLVFTSGTDQLLVDALWLLVLFLVWGYALTWTHDRLTAIADTGDTTVNESRRKFLSQLGGSVVAITLGALGLGAVLYRRSSGSAGQPIAQATDIATQSVEQATDVANTDSGFNTAPGTRPEITSNEDFYRVDINVAGAPRVDEETWTLTVDGLVNNPLTLTYQELRNMPSTEQYATLECISNPVGGDLIGTTLWTGVKLREVLEKAGLQDGIVEIKFTCADGYTETLPLESAMDDRSLLVYAMNNVALTSGHGFPLRLFTPNRYGMKNPKWITRIEAIDIPYDGYWEVRGWTKEAFYKTTSVIDAAAVDDAQNGSIPVGGIAFSGDRGISKVELSIDGDDWQQAEIKTPISEQTWHLWRFDWQATSGTHQLRVRAFEGDGTAQIERVAPLHPDGASGYHSFDITI